MAPTQADVDRWAGLAASAYAMDSTPAISPFDLRDLAAELDGPLSHCIMLAIPLEDRGPEYVNPVLARWEAKARGPRGRRLGAVNYALGSLVME